MFVVFCVNVVRVPMMIIRVGFEVVWNVERATHQKIVNVRQSKHRLESL